MTLTVLECNKLTLKFSKYSRVCQIKADILLQFELSGTRIQTLLIYSPRGIQCLYSPRLTSGGILSSGT